MGETLPGVNVIVKGSTNGAITDKDGKFEINIENPNDKILVFSSMGLTTIELKIGAKTTIDITMKDDVIGLDEVIVVGYGVQKKISKTGAISSVSSDALREVPTANAIASLQGKVAGATIVNDNTPGGEATIRIRGYGTINDADPLYVIDGVPTTGGISHINQNSIESITLLKDASSAAIYGARAANGVIIITTKKGKRGSGMNVTVSTKFGVQVHTNELDLLNTQQYANMLWMVAKNDMLVNPNGIYNPGNSQFGHGSKPVIPNYVIPAGASKVDESTYDFSDPKKMYARTDKEGVNWYDEVLEPAITQDFNIAISGGGEKSAFAFNAGYYNQKGNLKYTGFERFSLNSNISANITDWLEIGESVSISRTKRNGNLSNNGEGTVLGMVYRMPPYIPVYDIKGNFAGTKSPDSGNGMNPLSMLKRTEEDYTKQTRIIGNSYISLDLPLGIKFKSLVGFDINYSNELYRGLVTPEFAESVSSTTLDLKTSNSKQWNLTNTLNYINTFGKHGVTILLGTETVVYNYEYLNAGRSTYFSEDINYTTINAGEGSQANSGEPDEWKTFSYFGRVNYDFSEKYLVELVIRRDGSSRFSSNKRWGLFPAMSAGWRVSEESFLKNSNTISNLKLRVSWGQNGNDRVGNYNPWTTYRANIDESYYAISGSNTSTSAGFHKYKLGNPDGKWETVTSTNIGFELGLLKNKLTFILDLYTKTTEDMLYPAQIADTYGHLKAPSVNVGEMKNTGLDFEVGLRGDITKDLKYEINANLSMYKNEIIKLSGNKNEILWGQEIRQKRYSRSIVGEEYAHFYGYKVEGYFNSWDDVANYPWYGSAAKGTTGGRKDDKYSAPGKFKYKDINGDGFINSDDRTIIGSPHPDFTYGINLKFTYQKWMLSMFFSGSQGNDLINYVKRHTDFNKFTANKSIQRYEESWTEERYKNGATISMPIAISNDGEMQEPSSYFVEDGSYLRMKNLQLSYTLGNEFTKNLGLKNLQISAQVTNLFTITGYEGLDPEISDVFTNSIGIDAGIYPTPRTYMLGLNINF